jgi:hypothetical protein
MLSCGRIGYGPDHARLSPRTRTIRLSRSHSTAAGRSTGPAQMDSRLISGSSAKALPPPPTGRPKSMA